MQYEPPLDLLARMDFGQLFGHDAYGWMKKPMLIYLGCGRLMNKTANETVTLNATSDDEFWNELLTHGWKPAPPKIELRSDRIRFDSPEYAARIEKVQEAVESLMSKNPFRKGPPTK
jgi:hypothetical protein